MIRTLYHSIKHLFTKVTAPSLTGRLGSLEKPLNVVSAPQRGANPLSRRRVAGGESVLFILFFTLHSSLFTFTSCTSNEVGPAEERGVAINLMSYVAPYEEHEGPSPSPASEGRSFLTRAGWLPDKFSEDNSHKAIGAFFTTDAPSSEDHRFWYNNNITTEFPDPKWFIDGKTITPGNFYLYGYMPYNAADVTISQIESTPESTPYSEGAVLSYANLGSVMSKDVCVLAGAANSAESIKLGKFNVTMNSGENATNILYLLFEHVYARLEFRFRVDNGELDPSKPLKYASLRTIKLKKLELTAYTSSNLDYSLPEKMKESGRIEVHLKANNTETSPINNDIRFVPTSEEEMKPVVIFEGEETLPWGKYPEDYAVVDLRGKYRYTEETGYIPYYNFEDGSKRVYYVLKSYYDIYDKNVTTEHPEGNLIRKGCVAENAIRPSELFGTNQLECGKKYIVNLIIAPTYLYVLSEPDLDNPTVEFE